MIKKKHNEFCNRISILLRVYRAMENFNEVFFPALDSLLKQIDVIKDPDLKNGNIQKAYEWYKHNLENFHRINPIDIITKKPYYDYSPDVNLVNEKSWEAQYFPITFESDFRTKDDAGYLPAKDRLLRYPTKKLSQEFNEGKVVDIVVIEQVEKILMKLRVIEIDIG